MQETGDAKERQQEYLGRGKKTPQDEQKSRAELDRTELSKRYLQEVASDRMLECLVFIGD